jgi:hypothetical protein
MQSIAGRTAGDSDQLITASEPSADPDITTRICLGVVDPPYPPPEFPA